MKRIIKTIALLLIIAILTAVCGNILNIKRVADDALYNCKSFYATPKNTIDVITYGSSHAFCSVNNSYLWEKYGIAGHTFAGACQNLGNTYYYMEESLKTQKPKIMMVECFYFANNGYGVGSIYQNTLELKYSKNYIDNVRYARNVKNDSNDSRSFADLMLRWPIVHGRYDDITMEDFSDYKDFTRGYVMFLGNKELERPESTYNTDITPLDDESQMYLDKMVHLADVNDIPIIFFAAPFILSDEQMCKFNYMEEYLGSHGIPFINFNKPDNFANIDYATDFIEESHLNYYGANKATNFLGMYIDINYEIEDHQGDSRYTFWDQDLAYNKSILDEQKMNSAGDIDIIIDIAGSTNDTAIFCYNPNSLSDIQMKVLLAATQMSEEEISKNGAIILRDGKVIKSIIYRSDCYYEMDYDVIVYHPVSEDRSELKLCKTTISDADGMTYLMYNNVNQRVECNKIIDFDGNIR